VLDLKHLRTFIAVAEELSFRKAAERFNLIQGFLHILLQAAVTQA
jgi:DNA-binding transcriptional LysR family regulator